MVKNANPVSRLAVGAACAAVALMSPGCGRQPRGVQPAGATGASGVAAVKTVADYFSIRVGDEVVRMQLAVRPLEMQRGLMERRDLAEDQGMLFVYERPQQMSFWMRNTPTPLDIGFFGPDGVLQEVYPLHPFDETSVASRGEGLQFALEMNQGWYARKGIKPGARLDLQALADALRARGFDPARYGLGAGGQ